MIDIIGVSFKNSGKQYSFASGGIPVAAGQGVLVDTVQGPEYAVCTQANTQVDEMTLLEPLRSLIRVATEEDLAVVAKNHEKEASAFTVCEEKIREHGLDMKLVEVEYNFDGSKILFFFTSEGRVDFRALVKDLAGIFRTRIELRQIGVRDEAKMLGGLGICGRPFCCSAFLDEFQPVSIKMAKTQNLSLNPTKISGTCGRLMCCLKYEQDAYEDAVKRVPKAESFVECPDGVGTICQINLLRENVKVRLEDSNEAPLTYELDEINVIRSGKGKRPEDYVAPPKEELEKLRRVKEPEPSEEDLLRARLGSTLDSLGFAETPPAPAVETPDAPAQAAEGSSSHRRRRSRGGKKPAAAGTSDAPQAAESKKPEPKKAEPKKPEAAPASGESAKKPSSHRRHRPRGGKKSGGAPASGAPQA